MAKKRTRKDQRKRTMELDKRLAGYSLAAGAVLAMTAPVPGEVVRTPVNNTLHASTSFDIDFDGADGAEVRINMYAETYTSTTTSTSTYTSTYVSTYTSSSETFTNTFTATHTNTFTNTYTYTSYRSANARPLKSNVSFIGSGSSGYMYPYVLASSDGITASGEWLPATFGLLDYSSGGMGNWFGKQGFLGVRFNIGDSTHYGWVRMTCSGSSVTIHEYAYETQAGTGIPLIADALPVTLAGFSAVRGTGGVALTWRTETEEDNLGFVIERGNGDGAWEEIASYAGDDALRGGGTTAEPHDYAFTDGQAPDGTCRYRLSDVDVSGGRTVLGTITVEGAVSDITLQPVAGPGAVPGVRYVLPADARVGLAVMDVLGRRVRTLEDAVRPAGTHTAYWDGRNAEGRPVPAGTYLVVLESGGTVTARKVQWTGR